MGFSLSGLASGLDTASIIEQLIELERTPIYREESKIDTYEYEQEVFRSINTSLLSLRTAAADLTLNANFNLTSATNSDESVVMVSATDNASAGLYEIEVTQIAKAHVLQSNEMTSTDENDSLKDKTFTIYYGEEEITVKVSGDNYGEMMQNIADQINGADAGMTASVIETSPGNKRLIFTADETGTANSIQFDVSATEADGSKVTIKDPDGVLSTLGLTAANEAQEAKDAQFSVNNIDITRSTNTVTDVIEGVTLELLKGDNSSTSITIAKDAEKVADKVEAFVNAYNEVMSLIRNNTEQLDEDATYTNLQGDSTLRSLQMSLENWVTGQVAGTVDGYHLLSDIGIEADKGVTSASLMTGLLDFDRETFIEKFNDNPDAVKNLFTVDDTSEENEDGIGRLFNEALPDWTSTVDGIINSRIEGYDILIDDANDRIDRYEYLIELKEEQLNSQFTAMEVALATLQNEQSWLISQISSLSTSYS